MQSQLYPALYAPKGGYVFVVTYGRSGSTLTQKLLNSLPGYNIRGENGNILYHLARAATVVDRWEDFRWRRDDVGKLKSDQKDFLREIIGTSSDPWYGAELVNPFSLGKALANNFVSEVLKPNAETRVAGFKEIRWHEDRAFFENFLNFVQQFFPNSRFIFQTRNAESVANSSWWKNKSSDDVFAMISAAENLYRGFHSKNVKNSIIVEYDRYAEGPEYVKEVFEFLGEETDFDKVSEILQVRLKHA